MTLRVHYGLVCNGGFTAGCVRSSECEGYLVLDDGIRDVKVAVREAGWAWVVDVIIESEKVVERENIKREVELLLVEKNCLLVSLGNCL